MFVTSDEPRKIDQQIEKSFRKHNFTITDAVYTKDITFAIPDGNLIKGIKGKLA